MRGYAEGRIKARMMMLDGKLEANLTELKVKTERIETIALAIQAEVGTLKNLVSNLHKDSESK